MPSNKKHRLPALLTHHSLDIEDINAEIKYCVEKAAARDTPCEDVLRYAKYQSWFIDLRKYRHIKKARASQSQTRPPATAAQRQVPNRAPPTSRPPATNSHRPTPQRQRERPNERTDERWRISGRSVYLKIESACCASDGRGAKRRIGLTDGRGERMRGQTCEKMRLRRYGAGTGG